MDKYPVAPDHLSPRGRQLWDELGPSHAMNLGRQVLLELALTCIDKAAAARKVVADEGMFHEVVGKMWHVNAAVTIEKEAIAQAAKLWIALGLHFEDSAL